MTTILIAEDDENIRILTSQRLKSQFEVLCANDGKEALDIISNTRIDLLIADIMMPRMDGFELVQAVRRQGITVPVIMLTANHTFDAKRAGFSSGTDDYMTKPVNYEELVWRIQALLRRAKISSEKKIIVGKIILDGESYAISRDGISFELPKKEFELLYKLLSYPGRIFTKNQLLDDIWGYSSESGEDTVKTHISRLRNRLKDFNDFSIIAVKGIGYKAEIGGGSPA